MENFPFIFSNLYLCFNIISYNSLYSYLEIHTEWQLLSVYYKCFNRFQHKVAKAVCVMNNYSSVLKRKLNNYFSQNKRRENTHDTIF